MCGSDGNERELERQMNKIIENEIEFCAHGDFWCDCLVGIRGLATFTHTLSFSFYV